VLRLRAVDLPLCLHTIIRVGNLEPSQEDISITKQLVESGKILGIPVQDHIIFGEGGFYTFAERGLL